MAFLTESAARQGAYEYRLSHPNQIDKSSVRILQESAQTTATSFDAFLSHSRMDADIILGVRYLLEKQGLTVYVDWIDDPHLDRASVTTTTAERLRTRMRQSRTMIYVHSSNSPTSKWMPWELGFFDGYRSAVAILPIVARSGEGFTGQEYLSLYPHIDLAGATWWVNRGTASQTVFGPAGSSVYNLKDWIASRRVAAVR